MQKIRDKQEKKFVDLLLLIYLMPILRIVLDVIVGNYTLVTIIIYPILVVALCFINGGIKIRIRFWTCFFLSYIIIVAIFHMVAGNSSFVQAFSAVLRFVVFILSLNYVTFSNPSREGAYKVARYSLLFFCFTLIASLIQMFYWMPMHNLFLTVGGNMVSSTALNNIRVNGAVGGTVIAYGVYIVLCCFIVIFGHTEYGMLGKVFFTTGIIVTMFMNYSRACFIGVAIAFGGWFFFFKFKKLRNVYKFISIILVLSICYWYFSTDNMMVRYIFQNDIYRSVSDGKRIEASIIGIAQMNTLTKKLFGIAVGQNTGFATGGKILGDGAIVSFLIDYGIVGIILATAFFIEIIHALKMRASDKKSRSLIIIMFFDFFVLLVINSGFFENINIMLYAYPVYLYVYKVSIQTQSGE